MTETDLWGAEGFELSDEEDDVAVARAARIAASKKASSGYQAKIEEPGWYLSPSTSSSTSSGTIPASTRPEFFQLHQLYFEGSHSEAMDKGLALLQREHKAGAEDVELIDMVLRSAVKSKRETEVLDVARRWTGQRSQPTLAYSAARVLIVSPDPYEATHALLHSLSRHPALKPYQNQLARTLAPLRPLLAEVIADRSAMVGKEQEVLSEVDGLEWASEEEKETLKKVLGIGGVGVEEEEETVRDVRSL